MPKAYAIVRYTIDDADKFATYVPPAVATIVAHGGQVLVAGEDGALKEGTLPSARTVVVEFPSREAAESWYESADYGRVKPLRLESTSNSSFAIIDAFVPPTG